MATTDLLVNNVAEDPVELIGQGTLFPTGTFAGAHIRVKSSATEEGTYDMVAEIYDAPDKIKNIELAGGGWVAAEVVGAQAATDLGLVMKTQD